jgi:hypothetical protein
MTPGHLPGIIIKIGDRNAQIDGLRSARKIEEYDG